MEDNKYYTPELSEFHVGFEYEEKDIEWVSKGFDFYDLGIIDDEIREGKIRVKSLSKDDIIDLGFKPREHDVFRKFVPDFRGREDVIIDIILRHSILICFGDDETCYSDWSTLFSGTIKNKSELKKILIQLNINP